MTLAALALSVLGGLVFEWAGSPLPWMLGPLLTVAGLKVLGVRLEVPNQLRYAGQWVVGTGIGLYFTPQVLEHVPRLLPWVGLALVVSMALSIVAAKAMVHLGKVDPVTALYASFLGGAAEMANLAERAGARADRVAASQTLRVMLIVVLVPFAFRGLGIQGAEPAPAQGLLDPLNLVLLLSACGAGALLVNRIKVPNAFLLGSVIVSIVLAGFEALPTTMPASLVDAAQLLMGASLGARFSREFFRSAPRFMATSALCSVAVLLLSTLLALLLSRLSDHSFAALVLGLAPGGIAEMSLTAKVLHLAVPVVVVFQLCRLVVIVSTAPVVQRLALRWLMR